jgi:hypothetical protein
MGYRSSLPMLLMSVVGLFAVGFLSTCNADKAAADPDSGDRLGCGTYCQSAGGYGSAGPAPTQYAVTVVSHGTVTADPDGYVPVTVKCNLPTQCIGALVLNAGAVAGGRSDLLVDGGATRTIAVPFSSSAIAYLRSNGPTTFGVVADSSKSTGLNNDVSRPGPVGINLRNELTVAAPG